MVKKTLLALNLFYLLILISAGSAIRAADESQRWTPDDLLLAERAGDYQISPQGNWMVWVKSQMDKEKGRTISNLFLSSLETEMELALTRGKFTHSNPRWSPDGKRVAFLSGRPAPGKEDEDDSKTAIWMLNLAGGEPWPVTDLERDVIDFEWKDDQTLLFTAEEDPSLYEQEIKKRKDTSEVVEDAEHTPPVRIYSFSLKDKSVTRLTGNDDWIRAISVSPDGAWIVSVHQRSLSFAFDHKITPVIRLTRVDTGEVREIDPNDRLNPRGIEWARDSSGFYYATEYSSDPLYFTAAITKLRYHALGEGRTVEVDLDWGDKGIGGSVQATDNGFIALLADGVRFQPARYVKNGLAWTRTDLSARHEQNIWSWELGPDGRTVAYEYSTASTPEQIYQGLLEGSRLESPRQVTHLNPSFEKKTKHRVEILSWKGANDDTVEGLLYYPFNYEEGKRYPLMLVIHGGPSGFDPDAWNESWADPRVLLTQRGAFVLSVNYHGSGNYGLEWVESICCGKYYDLERVDLEAGVDYVIEKGLADPDRLGSMGWSNGAILTTELVTRNRRYKVASAGAGDVEWISDWGNVMFGASFDNYYFGKPPYEDPQFYVEKSPYFRLKDVTAPTIIFTGTDDVNVPPSQSWSHYRVLQQATDTPVRLVLFPGEPHGLRGYQHQRRKVDEEMAWLDRYFFKAPDIGNRSVKKGSPLERVLALHEAAQSDGQFGLLSNGILVPETVAYKGIRVGRFEVTRAQFAKFDGNYRYPEGTGNFPASGITFDQARAYASWLSEKSGETYRLPTAEEAEKLYEAGDSSQNTLDYWAGYSPNPEDRERLEEAAGRLEGAAPLLTAVGSFPGSEGGPRVFDLGGNAAEWVMEKEGSGVLKGGCAALPVKSKSPSIEAPAGYRGFRVVRP